MNNQKTSKGFVTYLAIFGMVGFITIILETALKVSLGKYAGSVLLVVLGLGLVAEGQVRYWIKRIKRAGRQTKISHLIAGIIGLIAIGLGLLKLVVVGSPMFNAMIIIIASIGVLIIPMETWVIK